MSTPDFRRVAAIIQEGHEQHAYPAAVIEVGRAGGPLWSEAFGRLAYEADASRATTETLFDLASLTKVIGTTTLAMRLYDAGRWDLSNLIARWLPDWRGNDRQDVAVRSLLTHSSGLTAYLPFFRNYSGRAEFQRAICDLPLEYPPDTQSIYSDLGFILLAFILEDAGARPFAAQVSEMLAGITSEPLVFNPDAALRKRAAPTEVDPWRGRLLVGEVHDENCWALGGAAGHAGLFGTAPAVGDFARAMLEKRAAAPDTVSLFTTKAAIRGSRALGWDTMLPTSSCGTKMSSAAYGHTGFTGTTLWIDPIADVYVVFLTNRVHPTRENNAIQQIRPAVHDAVMEAIGS